MSAPEKTSLFFDLFSSELPDGQIDLGRQEAPALPFTTRENQIDCGSLEDCSANIISSRESRRSYKDMSKLTVSAAQRVLDYHIGNLTITGL